MTRSSQRKGKRLIFLPHIAMSRATVIIAVTSTAITIKATNAITMIANLTIIIKMIDATNVVNATIRTQRATTSERQIPDLAKLFLSADQINLYFIQIIVNIRKFCGTY
jgi:hypothetical protein